MTSIPANNQCMYLLSQLSIQLKHSSQVQAVRNMPQTIPASAPANRHTILWSLAHSTADVVDSNQLHGGVLHKLPKGLHSSSTMTNYAAKSWLSIPGPQPPA